MTGFVYAMKCLEYPRVKIGWTKSDALSRKKELLTGCPTDLVIVALKPGTLKDESAEHDKFATHRVGGKREWFHWNDEVSGAVRLWRVLFPDIQLCDAPADTMLRDQIKQRAELQSEIDTLKNQLRNTRRTVERMRASCLLWGNRFNDACNGRGDYSDAMRHAANIFYNIDDAIVACFQTKGMDAPDRARWNDGLVLRSVLP